MGNGIKGACEVNIADNNTFTIGYGDGPVIDGFE